MYKVYSIVDSTKKEQRNFERLREYEWEDGKNGECYYYLKSDPPFGSPSEGSGIVYIEKGYCVIERGSDSFSFDRLSEVIEKLGGLQLEAIELNNEKQHELYDYYNVNPLEVRYNPTGNKPWYEQDVYDLLDKVEFTDSIDEFRDKIHEEQMVITLAEIESDKFGYIHYYLGSEFSRLPDNNYDAGRKCIEIIDSVRGS